MEVALQQALGTLHAEDVQEDEPDDRDVGCAEGRQVSQAVPGGGRGKGISLRR